jgi:RimJ/RimL family protein N-acetyltransferase
MFEQLKAHRPSRPAMLFVRSDNPPSLQAHQKMGMRELGTFVSDGVPYVAFTYRG